MSFQYLISFPHVRGVDKLFEYKYTSDKKPEKQLFIPDDLTPDDFVASVDFPLIAFPLKMYGELTKLSDSKHNMPIIINNPKLYHSYVGTNEGQHSAALLYNTLTQELEVIDYEFGLFNMYYNYEEFLNKHLIEGFKKFFPTVPVTAVRLPMIRENRFYYIRELLRKNRFPYDFSIVYKSYLANYLTVRTQPEYINKPVAFFTSNREVLQFISPRKNVTEYINNYLRLCKAMKEFPYDSKWIPIDNTNTNLFNFNKPCPEGQMRDLFTGKCVKIPADLSIELPMYDMKEGAPLHPDPVIKWVHFIIEYFMKQYPNVAMLVPTSKYTPHPYEYMIQFNDTRPETAVSKSQHRMSTRSKKAPPRMDLILPANFDELIDKAFDNEKIRFIILIIGIKFEGAHASPVIIDKDNGTIERIEVNAPFIEKMGDTLEDDLDNRLEQTFKSYPDLKNFEYIRPMSVCPYGLHRAEFVERTENVSDIGGRCVEWTLYYIHLKLKNEDIPTKMLSAFALEQLRKTGSIKHMITGYTTGLIKESRRRKPQPVIQRKPLELLSRVKSAPIATPAKTSSKRRMTA